MESVEQMREAGKAAYFASDATLAQKQEGFQLIHRAYLEGDLEAMYLLGRLVLDGSVRPSHPDPEEHGLLLVCEAANKGFLPARVFLNGYCLDRYQEDHRQDLPLTGPLVDFEGKIIKIDRQGVFTPVDAVLRYENGENILYLQANLQVLCHEQIPNEETFMQAICRGIMAWEGEYTVFGGQKVTVRVKLTWEDKAFDNLIVMPVTDGVSDILSKMGKITPNKDKRAQMDSVVDYGRSFASVGLKWSATSRKMICIQSRTGDFSDLTEMTHIAKHEFGHVLGLGDLYACSIDALAGVEEGTFRELDSYHISDRQYNLVMCDYRGPISNNDIEMVILAFRENKMQLYQASRYKGKISAALGKGN